MNSKLIVPILAIVVCIGLGIAGVAFILGQIGPTQQQISQLETDTKTLSSKRDTLENARNFLTTQADITRLTLPSGNPTAAILSQLRRVAQEEGVILESLNASSYSIEGGPNSTRFELKATGTYPQVAAFFLRLQRLLPLVNLEELKVEGVGGNLEVSAALLGYWSPLPQTLPEITGTLSNLSEDEINLLNRLSGFELPAFEELIPEVATDSARPDPFAPAQ